MANKPNPILVFGGTDGSIHSAYVCKNSHDAEVKFTELLTAMGEFVEDEDLDNGYVEVGMNAIYIVHPGTSNDFADLCDEINKNFLEAQSNAGQVR